MWKFLKKGFKCGKSVKAPFAVVYPDDAQPTHQCAVKISKTWSSQTSHYHTSYEDSGGGGGGGGSNGNGPDREWKWKMHAFQHDIWTRQSCCHVLEVMGWGSAVITYFQVSDLCHQTCRPSAYEKKCWLSSFMNAVPQFSWSQMSHVLTAYTTYTVSCLMHTITNTVLSARYMLPDRRSKFFNATAIESKLIQKEEVGNKIKQTSSLEWEDTPEDDFASSLQGLWTETNEVSSTNKLLTADSVDDCTWHQLVEKHLSAVRRNANALKYARRGDLSMAVQLWSDACGNPIHSPLSLFNLAVCYEQGIGVDKDMDKAADLYFKASELGHAKSAFNLAVMILQKSSSDDSIQQAMSLLQKAADMGLKEAQRELGVLYTEQRRRNMVQAAELFEKASAQRDAHATYFLGICYERGWGVAQNEAKAASLYKLSAELGCADAFYNLAAFFEHGLGGLPLDLHEAVHCYQAASNAGNLQAAEKLNSLRKQHPHLLSIITDDKAVDTKTTDSMPTGRRPVALEDGSLSPLLKLYKFSVSPDSGCDGQSESSPVWSSDDELSDTSTSCSGGMKFWQVSVRSKKQSSKASHVKNFDFGINSSSGDIRCKTRHEDAGQRPSMTELQSCGPFYEALHHRVADDSLNNILLNRGSFGQVSISSSVS